MRVVIDAFGGDNAPIETVKGAQRKVLKPGEKHFRNLENYLNKIKKNSFHR